MSTQDAEFDAKHPGMYATFVGLAERLVAMGRTKFSARLIVGKMRWDGLVEGKDGGFRINDHRAEVMARRLVRERPEFAGFFEFRKSRHDRQRGQEAA